MEKTGGHRRPLKVVVEPERKRIRRFNAFFSNEWVVAAGHILDWLPRFATLYGLLKLAVDFLF